MLTEVAHEPRHSGRGTGSRRIEGGTRAAWCGQRPLVAPLPHAADRREAPAFDSVLAGVRAQTGPRLAVFVQPLQRPRIFRGSCGDQPRGSVLDELGDAVVREHHRRNSRIHRLLEIEVRAGRGAGPDRVTEDRELAEPVGYPLDEPSEFDSPGDPELLGLPWERSQCVSVTADDESRLRK